MDSNFKRYVDTLISAIGESDQLQQEATSDTERSIIQLAGLVATLAIEVSRLQEEVRIMRGHHGK